MEIVDPSQVKRKPKGGEDFEAEPGAEQPSQVWRDSQIALLKLTVNQNESWGTNLPELESYQEYGRHGSYEWDPQEERFYQRAYVTMKVRWRYYRGNKKRSYLFWPKHVTPGFGTELIIKNADLNDKLIQVTTVTGKAWYSYVGTLDNLRFRKPGMCLALWKSTGTMKARKNVGNQGS